MISEITKVSIKIYYAQVLQATLFQTVQVSPYQCNYEADMLWHVTEAWEDNVKQQGRLKIAHNCQLNSKRNHSSSDESWKGKEHLPWAENVTAFTPLLFTGNSGPTLAKCPTLCMDSCHYSEGVTREKLYRNAKHLCRLSDRQMEILEKTLD